MLNSPGGSRLPPVKALKAPVDRSVPQLAQVNQTKTDIITEMVLITARTGICYCDSDSLADTVVARSARAVVCDGDGATTEAPLIHPIGRESSNISRVRVVVAARSSYPVLVIVGCWSVMTRRRYMSA